ncbi:hypothetical protein KAF25_002006 [Fusarium avenaceum]|uniref:PAN-3 domain-containing protein n=1 Tax=Fusarium avenaceum TaxID=40199 RepID=A0A9P7GYL4_9HYPO|nr:hypothetical protein KAF25_002006 [Fusarium avenaceum]
MLKRLGVFWALNLSLVPTVLAAASCSQLSGRIYTGPDSNIFDISCDTSTIGGHIFAYYSNGDEFQDCVDKCDGESTCVVALFLAGSGDCALIDSYSGTRSFNGNDVAVKRPVAIQTATSVEVSSSATTTAETTTAETTTAETTTVETTTAETTTVETTTAETTTVETTTVETTSPETTTVETTSPETTSPETTTVESSTAEASLTESTPSGASLRSSEVSLTSPESTLVTATTDLSYTSTTSIEILTDDCEDETSSLETSTSGIASTATGSEIKSTNLSTNSLSPSTTMFESSEPPTSRPSTTSNASLIPDSTTQGTQTSESTSLPSLVTSQAVSALPTSSITTAPFIDTTFGQVASSSRSSSSETKDTGSKTPSDYGVTIMKTTSESRLPTSFPTSNCVWTVHLTMVKYVTCSTGIVAQTETTTTYVTADSKSGSYGPPVVQRPDGCIGGYQIDASGNSYPIAQPTMGSQDDSTDEKSQPFARPTPESRSGSRPSHKNGPSYIPAPITESQRTSQLEQGHGQHSVLPTQGSQIDSPDNKSHPSVPGQVSPEPKNSDPQSTEGEAAPTAISKYQPGTPVYPSPPSSVHQGQQGIPTTLTIKTAITEESETPSVSLSATGEVPSTPLVTSGANSYQPMFWQLVAGILLALQRL